jgi:hypothetical protein
MLSVPVALEAPASPRAPGAIAHPSSPVTPHRYAGAMGGFPHPHTAYYNGS